MSDDNGDWLGLKKEHDRNCLRTIDRYLSELHMKFDEVYYRTYDYCPYCELNDFSCQCSKDFKAQIEILEKLRGDLIGTKNFKKSVFKKSV